MLCSFRFPTEEELGISDIVRSNIYLQSVPFELPFENLSVMFALIGTKILKRGLHC